MIYIYIDIRLWPYELPPLPGVTQQKDYHWSRGDVFDQLYHVSFFCISYIYFLSFNSFLLKYVFEGHLQEIVMCCLILKGSLGV